MKIWHLKQRLRIAIACLPLATVPFGAGCSKSKRTTEPGASGDAGSIVSKGKPTPVDAEVLVATQHSGECPSGTLCSSKAEMAKLELDGSPDVFGCSTAFDRAKIDKLPPGDRDHRLMGVINLDQAKTAETQKTDANGCCYQWVTPCAGGRPALDRGRPVRAAVVVVAARKGKSWCGA